LSPTGEEERVKIFMKFIYGCWKLYGMLCQLQSDPSGDHVVVRRSKKITPNTGGRKYMATG